MFTPFLAAGAASPSLASLCLPLASARRGRVGDGVGVGLGAEGETALGVVWPFRNREWASMAVGEATVLPITSWIISSQTLTGVAVTEGAPREEWE